MSCNLRDYNYETGTMFLEELRCLTFELLNKECVIFIYCSTEEKSVIIFS